VSPVGALRTRASYPPSRAWSVADTGRLIMHLNTLTVCLDPGQAVTINSIAVDVADMH
jgi:hypothetical protein